MLSGTENKSENRLKPEPQNRNRPKIFQVSSLDYKMGDLLIQNW